VGRSVFGLRRANMGTPNGTLTKPELLDFDAGCEMPVVEGDVQHSEMCNAAPEWGSCSSHVNYILSRVEDVKVNIGVLILRAEKRFSTSCAPVHHLMTTVFTW